MSTMIRRDSWAAVQVTITDDAMPRSTPIVFNLVVGSARGRHVLQLGEDSTAICHEDMLELLKALKEVYEK